MKEAKGRDSPSFVHAAVSGVKMARRPSESAENFMMALSHGQEVVLRLAKAGARKSLRIPKRATSWKFCDCQDLPFSVLLKRVLGSNRTLAGALPPQKRKQDFHLPYLACSVLCRIRRHNRKRSGDHLSLSLLRTPYYGLVLEFRAKSKKKKKVHVIA